MASEELSFDNNLLSPGARRSKILNGIRGQVVARLKDLRKNETFCDLFLLGRDRDCSIS